MFRRKIHKRVRFDVDPLLDRESDTPNDDIIDNKHIHESEVLEEDPLDASKDFGDGVVLTENDFWDYVYSHVWSGRLRVCEGNLLRTLIRVSKVELIWNSCDFSTPTDPLGESKLIVHLFCLGF